MDKRGQAPLESPSPQEMNLLTYRLIDLALTGSGPFFFTQSIISLLRPLAESPSGNPSGKMVPIALRMRASVGVNFAAVAFALGGADGALFTFAGLRAFSLSR